MYIFHIYIFIYYIIILYIYIFIEIVIQGLLDRIEELELKVSRLQKNEFNNINPIAKFIRGFNTLFFNTKTFTSHRVFGLTFIILYIYAFILYFADYEEFKGSFAIIGMPILSVIQPINAVRTFHFLPKGQIDGGYFSYKPGNRQGSLSYAFVKENVFFGLILCFQWLYYNENLYPYFQIAWPLEYLFVFLPYVVRTLFPDLFPRTSFRDSLKNQVGYILFYIIYIYTFIFNYFLMFI